VPLRLTRLTARPTADPIADPVFTGVCERAGHPIREVDARGYWR
jgi:hypothetical protein